MRLIDFFVYYISTLYKNKSRGNLFWDSPVRRTVFIVGLTIGLWLLIASQLLLFFISNKNLMDYQFWLVGFIISVVLITQLLRYTYIVKKRYQFITSLEYNSFTLTSTHGIIICVVVPFLGLVSTIAIGIIIK